MHAATEAMREPSSTKRHGVCARRRLHSGGGRLLRGSFNLSQTILMGFGLPDDNLHAPNEKFLISNFYLGIESIVRFLEMLGV